MRRAQDLAVSANPDPDIWAAAADRVEELVALLGPFEAPEGVGPANRVPSLPGAGSLLMAPDQPDRLPARRLPQRHPDQHRPDGAWLAAGGRGAQSVRQRRAERSGRHTLRRIARFDGASAAWTALSLSR